MFWLGLISGMVIGVIFHAGLRSHFDKAKDKAKEIIEDLSD